MENVHTDIRFKRVKTLYLKGNFLQAFLIIIIMPKLFFRFVQLQYHCL